LYGNPDGTWDVQLPAEEVPPELPEPALGINFARDGMQVRTLNREFVWRRFFRGRASSIASFRRASPRIIFICFESSDDEMGRARARRARARAFVISTRASLNVRLDLGVDDVRGVD